MSEQEWNPEVHDALTRIRELRPDLDSFEMIVNFAVLTLARVLGEDKLLLTRDDLEKLLANAGAVALSRHIGRRVVAVPNESGGGGDFLFLDTGEPLPNATAH